MALRFSLVFLTMLVLWCAGGFLLNKSVSDHNNEARLKETAQLLIRRAEKAIDYVVIAGTELVVAGQTTCGETSRSILRERVLTTGMVSNLHLVTPSGTCSSFDEVDGTLPTLAARNGWTQARNPAYRIGPIQNGNRSLIGVSWGLGTALELVSSINADAMLFDVLTVPLRSHSKIELSTHDFALSTFVGDGSAEVEMANWVTFTATGERYPLAVAIELDRDVLRSWRQPTSIAVILLWSVFGFLISSGAAIAYLRGWNQELEDVQHALSNQDIIPHYQPIVDIATGEAKGCEALARWIRTHGETVSPVRFIPLIEEHGLDNDLLTLMIEQTAVKMGDFLKKSPDFYVSFNVTPNQLTKPEFADLLIALARKHRLAPKQICLEITERQVIEAPDHAANTTAKLAAAGFKLSIDDAGTGHNGLAAIQQLDVDAIKIDKFFIDNIDEDPRSRVMVDMFVSVAQRYELVTVAEGVETMDQLRVLKAAGVTLIQGFVVARPLPPSEMITTLEQGNLIALAARKSTAKKKDRPSANVQDHRRGDQVKLPGFNQDEASDELARLKALYQYQIMDTEAEEVFDRIPRIVKSALNGSFAAIAFIDSERRWFKAVSGGQRGELPRHLSFCNHTIQSSEPTIVEDTSESDEFRENVLVVKSPHIRAYLGVPLQTEEGHRIGSLCCVDQRPRQFTKEQIQLVKDLSAIVMEQLELRQLALFDPLTTARSRAGFRAEAELLFEVSRRQNRTLSMVVLDIDHFKQINDGFGHKIGDEILAELGRRVHSVLGDNAIFGRVGGEEFAIAQVDMELAEALIVAEEIRTGFDTTPCSTSRGPIPVTISFGATKADLGTNGIDDMLEQADWALY
ncbi:MAG: EAL domain-containing protein [Pseudomonadota bacterium]